jgi:hypothetical protein
MTAADWRDELRRVCAASTPGPWEVSDGFPDQEPRSVLVVRSGLSDLIELGPEDRDANTADAQFIAAARRVLPGLLDRLDAAEAEVRRLQALAETAGMYCAAIERREPPAGDIYEAFKALLQ